LNFHKKFPHVWYLFEGILWRSTQRIYTRFTVRSKSFFPRLMSQGHIRTNDTLNKDEQNIWQMSRGQKILAKIMCRFSVVIMCIKFTGFFFRWVNVTWIILIFDFFCSGTNNKNYLIGLPCKHKFYCIYTAQVLPFSISKLLYYLEKMPTITTTSLQKYP
jgi:hypothetical protein